MGMSLALPYRSVLMMMILILRMKFSLRLQAMLVVQIENSVPMQLTSHHTQRKQVRLVVCHLQMIVDV